MGTKVQIESCFPGYFSMRDLNEDSNSCGWPLYYGDRTFTNGQYYNGFSPSTVVDVYSGYESYDKDVVKRTMLEHEAIFKNQLCELHRLYRIQRDLMDEARRKELNKNRMPVETSLSSSPLASQITSEDARKWHITGFPLGNYVCVGPSTSGIEDMNSPLSSKKGSSVQASPLLSRNAGTSKDVEVFESRPTKVRRKMFDLHLPADAYIETEAGEQSIDENRNGNHESLKIKSKLADLNEPVEIEDTNTSSNDRVGCYEIEELELGAKSKSEFLGFPQGVLENSHKDRSDGAFRGSYLQNNDNRKSWFPRMPDSGNSKNNYLSVTRDLQPEKMPSSSETIQVKLNKNNETATLFLTNQTVHGSQLAERKKESSANSHPVSVVTSNIPSRYRVDPSSDLSKPWSHSISSWDKLNCTLNPKSMPVQVNPCLNFSASLSRSSQSSTQSHGVFGNKWNYNASSTSNPRTQSDMPDKNGFYHGSSSGSKELLIKFPSGNNDYNANSTSNSSLIKMASQKRLEVIDLERNQDDDDAVTLPWLHTKSNCKNKSFYAGVDLNVDMNSLNLSSDINESGKVSNQLVFQDTKLASCANGVNGTRIAEIGSLSCRKILGFPIFEKPHSSKMESEVVENNSKIRVLDINLPCDQEIPDTQVTCVRHQIDLNSCVNEDETGLTPSDTGSIVKKISGIDLEAPAVPEDEEDIVPGQEHVVTANAESLLQPVHEKDDISQPDEYIRTAAEAIVAISSSDKDIHHGENSMTDPLQWFAELVLVSSLGEVLDNKYAASGEENFRNNNGYSSEDYFESMTLRLTETKEEDYMPKPLVPENLVLPEVSTASLLTTRTRRGHGRRGRQKRDFQRDILPGLVSLSRHEVTEDLQTFGGIMRATGQLWHSGLTRRNATRNGCGRGRRRSLITASPAATPPPPTPPPPPPPPLIHQLNNVEDRNLTGWGKTTRRPRRQRCPPVNPAALPLT